MIDQDAEQKELLGKISALEKRSQHPLASAILKKADEEAVDYEKISVDHFTSLTGKGIQGDIDGVTYYVGSPSLFNEVSTLDAGVNDKIKTLQNEGKTVVVAGTKEKVQVILAVADEVREASQNVIQKLHREGIEKTIMLTGDNANTGNAIGKQVGVTDVRSELLPQDKLKVIRSLRERHQKVAMVGDGVNDAPALAASTVGIAMGGAGTDTALETADVALMGDDLEKLPFLVRLSRKTLNTIKGNITFAIAIKVAALLLVIPGWLTLWIAILSDMGATILVALNSMRLMRVKEE